MKATDEKVSERAISETSLTLLPSDTLLIAMYGGFNQIGRTGITTFVGVTNQAISSLIPKGDFFDVVFLQNYLNHNVGKWRNVAASSRKDPNLTKSDIENFKVVLPDKEEQSKIASFLSLLDQKIEKKQEKIEQMELLKKGMLQKIFSQDIRFKDENGREFPEWREVALGDLGSFVKSYAYSRSYEGEGEYYHIYYGDIHSKFKGIVDSETEIPSLSIDASVDSFANSIELKKHMHLHCNGGN
ncbi:restriction endonuclease subunit S [Brevibacillus laterosporus]|uniref:restriction endonuclease subunit S n=2 Tax=Bacteria TaxID=2 RepID=UPI002E237ED5|nr:restriction endonuclease subunit S [Brevibacillus laterosporus]MED1788349.1 restriction endonuclease subunit S [Brevibacillus laterosporus]